MSARAGRGAFTFRGETLGPMSADSGPAPASSHPVLVWVLVVVGALLLVVSSVTLWARNVALDSARWNDQSSQLIADPAIRAALTTYLVDEIFATGAVSAQVQQALPPRLAPLSAPLAGALQQGAYRVANEALTRPRVQAVWREASARAHDRLIAVMEGDSTFVRLNGKDVTLQTAALVRAVARSLGLDGPRIQSLGAKAPPIVLMRSDQLTTVQRAYRVLKNASIFIGLTAFVLWAIAVWLAAGNRREVVRRIAVAIGLGGLLLVVGRSLAGGYVVDSLVPSPTLRPSVHAVWDIYTAVLAQIAWLSVAVGVAGVLWTLASGPGRRAVALRRAAAPTFAEHPAAIHAGLAVVVLLLLWWQPFGGNLRVFGQVVLVALGFTAVELLRRQAVREAVPPPVAEQAAPPTGSALPTP